MSTAHENSFEEGDFVVHAEYNRGLTTIIEHLTRDKHYAIIKDGDRFVSTLLSELIKYVPKDE